MLNVWCSCCDGALCDVKTPSILASTTIIMPSMRSRLLLLPNVQHWCFHPQHGGHLAGATVCFSMYGSIISNGIIMDLLRAPLKATLPCNVTSHTPQLPCDHLKFLLEYKEWDKRSYFRLVPCLLLRTSLAVPKSVCVASERKSTSVPSTYYTKLQVENDETCKNGFICSSCKTAAKCSNIVIGR